VIGDDQEVEDEFDEAEGGPEEADQR